MSGPQTKMPKGIQFVKSSETLKPESTVVNTTSTSHQPLFPNPPSLFASPIELDTFGGGGASSQQSPQSQFGGPAVNFGAKKEMPGKYNQSFVKSGDDYSSLINESSSDNNYRMPEVNKLNGKIKRSKPFIPPIPKTTKVQPMCTNDEYHDAWKNEKDPLLEKIRKLAYEIVTLKSDRPNAMDKIHSAANKVPIRIEFNIEPIMGPKNSNSFKCFVFIENIDIASGQGPKRKKAKSEAYETALENILMPHMRIVSTDPTSKLLETSRNPFTSQPRQPSKVPLQNNSASCQHKESNLEAAGLKRRFNEYKNLDEFVIVEPKIEIPDCTAAHTLRRSADFNHMLLEYEYFFKGESARCILKIENEVLADVNGVSKAAAKNQASSQALTRLKKFCWIIKTKKAVDSNSTISKDEIFNELSEQSDIIANDNIGNKMLRKMGWSGGGVGKDGDGIAEPVSLKSVLNREGLGLGSSKGITDEFKKRIKEVIENYASSDNQEDLVFSADFRLEERQIIHDESRRLNLRSKSRGKSNNRYLVVRRKRSVNQLFDHLMSVGGETTRYQLVPPGTDTAQIPTNLENFSQSPKPLMQSVSSSQGHSFSNSPGQLLQTPASNSGIIPTPAAIQNKGGVGGGGFQFENKTSCGVNKYRVNDNNSNRAPYGGYGSNNLGVSVSHFGGGNSNSSSQSGFGYGNVASGSSNHQTAPSQSWNNGGNGSGYGGHNQGGNMGYMNMGGFGNSAQQSMNYDGSVGGNSDMSGAGYGNNSNNWGYGQGYRNNSPGQGYGNNGLGQGYGNSGLGQGCEINVQGQSSWSDFQTQGNSGNMNMGQVHQGYGNNTYDYNNPGPGTGMWPGGGGGSGYGAPSSSSFSSYPPQQQGSFRGGFRKH